MQYALDAGGQRVEATKDGRATCDICSAAMIAKVGTIVVPHWAHESVEDCDPWWEPESLWHRGWKSRVPLECREVRLPPHRADIRLKNSLVIELQHSSIAAADIAAREAHYETMIWLFDATEAWNAQRIEIRKDNGKQQTFRWKHPRKSVSTCTKPVRLDLGDGNILCVISLHLNDDGSCFGSGHIEPHAAFLRRMLNYPERAIRNWLAA